MGCILGGMSQRTIPRPFPFDLPGVTVEWLAKVNNCSSRSIRRWRASLPLDNPASTELLMRMTPKLAQEMALLRPAGTLLPFWSRMAISQLASEGVTYTDLMRMFRVSRSTVYRAIHCPNQAFCPLSGRRQLTTAQTSLTSKSR